jgi:MoaA/NifB/PqqE/SkfB family radical SAM enzyme
VFVCLIYNHTRRIRRNEEKNGGNDIKMEFKNIDKSMMMIFLLEECNFSCDHCAREDEPMYPGYKLSFDQLKMCLSDCQNLKTIEWVHFSGGEPTLWIDEELNLVDLLIEISNAGYEPGFTTNGSNFLDYNKCYNFFKKYHDHAKKKLRLYISIDTFHGNFDIEKGRAKSLDNVIRSKMDMFPGKEKLLKIIVLVIVSKETKSLLPNEMVEYYESQGIEFNFIPLEPKGKAKAISHLCPDLESNKPEDLGAYYPFYKKKKGSDKKSNLILIGNDYYLYDYDHNIEFTYRWHKIAQLGYLAEKMKSLEDPLQGVIETS